MVLLHGPGGNAAHWLRVIPELVATHRVIVPDLPGQGASALDGDGALDADRVLSWLDELIERTCVSPPALVGLRWAARSRPGSPPQRSDRICRLVLVDALGLTDFDPAPEFGLALSDFLARPAQETHTSLWRRCARDLDGLRRAMDERWEAFEDYNLDRAQSPDVQAALGGLMAQFGMPAIPDAELSRIAVPTTLIWGRQDLATPLSVAEDAGSRHGWPVRVIEDCADDPPIEQPEAFLRSLRGALADPRLLAATGFGGEIVGRGQPSYDQLRRVFNGMIDRRPALLARCADARRRGGGDRVRTRVATAGIGLRRRPQRHRQCGLRRRCDDRPPADEASRGRCRRAHLPAPTPASPGASSTAPPRSTAWP